MHVQIKVASQIETAEETFLLQDIASPTRLMGSFFLLKLTITCYDFCLQGRIQKVIEVGEIFKKAV